MSSFRSAFSSFFVHQLRHQYQLVSFGVDPSPHAYRWIPTNRIEYPHLQMMLPLQVTCLFDHNTSIPKTSMRNSLSFLSTKPLKFHPSFPTNQPTLYCNQKGSSCSTWRKSARALSKSCTYKNQKKLHKKEFWPPKVLGPRFFSFVCWTNANRKVVKKNTWFEPNVFHMPSSSNQWYLYYISYLCYILNTYTQTHVIYTLYNT